MASGNACTTIGLIPDREVLDDNELQYVGRRLGPHLHFHAAARRRDGYRSGRGPRRQEPQGMVVGAPAKDDRKERFAKGVREFGDGPGRAQRRRKALRASCRVTADSWLSVEVKAIESKTVRFDHDRAAAVHLFGRYGHFTHHRQKPTEQDASADLLRAPQADDRNSTWAIGGGWSFC